MITEMMEAFPRLRKIMSPEKWAAIRDLAELAKALIGQSWGIRELAVGTLGRLANDHITDKVQQKQVIYLLSQALERDESVEVRTRAALCLLGITGGSSIPIVARALKENRIQLVPKPSSVLASQGERHSEVYNILVSALRKVSKREVVAALIGLEELGDVRAIPEIIKLIENTQLEKPIRMETRGARRVFLMGAKVLHILAER